MRVVEGLHVEWVDDEAVILNPATGELHYLNPPAALAYALLLEHGYEGAVEELATAVRSLEKSELDSFVSELVAKGLLQDG